MGDRLTCKDCQAFEPEDTEVGEILMGVCTLNPPQMISERDPDTGEPIIISAFPKVNGDLTRCMKLVKIVAAIGLILFFSGCAPQERLGGQSVLGHAWSNYVRRQDDLAHGRGYTKCLTRKDPWGRIVTECR